MPKISILQLKKHIKNNSKEGLAQEIIERFKKIVDDTSGIGWGFHDSLGRLVL